MAFRDGKNYIGKKVATRTDQMKEKLSDLVGLTKTLESKHNFCSQKHPILRGRIKVAGQRY
jgi:hypothetical protein